MATVGLRNFYVAELTDETGSTATYGPARKLAPAIEASVTPNIESATLYGDDRAVEVAESLGSIEVEINVADLSPDDYAFLLGKTKNADGVVEDHIDDVAPYVALMFELPKADGNRKLYTYFKGKFQPTATEATTKGDAVEFQTQAITGTFMAREDGKWRAHLDTSDTAVDSAVVDAWFEAPYVPTTVAP